VEWDTGNHRLLVSQLLGSRRAIGPGSHWLEVWSLELVQRWGGGIHMNRWRVGEDRGSKETDGCPLTGTWI
jgi:hypothetical protein